MLTANAPAKTTDGPSRLNPSDFPRATAHTASNSPETTSTNHAMTDSSMAVLSLSGYGSLVRRTGSIRCPP